jgi:glycosyltransferase involved in cell wall biosynthesis
METATRLPMLDTITPVLLTYNEAPNIARTLRQLVWAKDIVVVDSGSTDGTLEILKATSGVRVFQRPFDSHHAQWRYAMEETGITTSWLLRLDADYQVPDALIAELAALDPGTPQAAFRAGFEYAVFSQKLFSSLYPAKPILLRRGRFSIRDDGHTESWVIDGAVGDLRARVIHDDWKSMRAWAEAQIRYMAREHGKLESRRTGMRDWLRLHPPLMPIAVFIYCLIGKGLIFSGRAGLLYTLQRTIAEGILALFILEKGLSPKAEPRRGVEKSRHDS